MYKTILFVFALIIAAACMTGCKSQQAKAVPAVKEEAVLSAVNVPNPNGSMTPVVIRRVGNLWMGPKGEVYQSYPTADQLKPVYGLK